MEIKLENVSYIYNKGTAQEVRALDNVSLALGGNSFTAVIGATGSGKSTLIQLLDGLICPSEGRVYYDGEEIFGKPDEKKRLREIRCRVGLTFQYPEYQLFEENVLSDVMFGPKNRGLSAQEAKERAMRALSDVGMGEEYYEKSPFELSGGQMRRAAIAGILAMEPEILILDEPTAGLDPLFKKKALDKIAKIQKERHISVVLVTHSMEEAANYAERVIVMSKARVVYDGETHEVFSNYRELEKLGLRAPDVTYFMNGLAESGINVNPGAITVEEAKESILALYRAG